MRTLNELLEAHPVFHDFPKEFVEDLGECTWEMEFIPDQYVFWSGHDAKFFYILRSGSIALVAHTQDQGKVTIETLHNGDVLGWSWLYPPYKWHFDAKTIDPARVIVVDARCVLAKCEQNHELGYELMLRFSRIMLDRLMATRMRMLDIYTQSI